MDNSLVVLCLIIQNYIDTNNNIYPAISTFAVQIYHTNKFLLYS
jgi:hypothetical protein